MDRCITSQSQLIQSKPSRCPIGTVGLLCDVALTHWGREKIAAISQMTFSNDISWVEMYEFRLIFHWILLLMSEFIIPQHRLKWCLGADQNLAFFQNWNKNEIFFANFDKNHEGFFLKLKKKSFFFCKFWRKTRTGWQAIIWNNDNYFTDAYMCHSACDYLFLWN